MKYCSDSMDVDTEKDFKMQNERKLQYEGHCITGVFECAHVLESCPEDVICCILHSNSNRVDVSTRIQHILIEAYCLENEIEVIKVDSQDEIASLLKMTPLDEKELDCILICKKEVATDSETDSSFQDSDDEYDWPS